MTDIKIPFLGDGIESANVISILVNPGDEIDIDDTILDLETDKATAPVPSTVKGTVDSILVKEGDIVKEGMTVINISETNKTIKNPKNDTNVKNQVIQTNSKKISEQVKNDTLTIPNINYEAKGDISSVNTSISIKQFAMLSGLDITRITGSGHGNRVTWEDIHKYMLFLQHSVFNKQETSIESIQKKPKINHEKFGPIERIKLSSLRQKIANNLVSSWNEIPHVTQFADINIDNLMTIRKSYNAKLKTNDIKLTVTIFMCRAIAETLKKFPKFNSSIDNNELIIKQYFNLGVAVDTDSGLVVPVVTNIDKKSLQEIAISLDELAQKARNKKLSVNDIQGGTFTLSNLGGLGASHFTPIVNSPQVAILGTGRATFKPLYNEKTKKISNQLIMPVTLSYDHRVIDGADAARFIQELTNNIEYFDKKWVD